MKRFLSLLTVFMLAFALAVPASATGLTYFYNEFEAPALPDGKFEHWVIYQYTNSGSVNGHYFAKNIKDVGTLDSKNEILLQTVSYHLVDGQWVYEGEDSKALIHTWVPAWYNFIWSSTDIYRTDGTVFISGSDAVPNPNSICNGSSCPATDVNIDGICDDCGMALMSLSRTPVSPEIDGNNQNYVMFYSGSVYKYTIYSSDEPYTIRGEEYGARYRTYTDPAVTVTRFESHDGLNWSDGVVSTSANDYPGEIGYELISSTFDWYTEEGDRFFPVPLWEEVQTVTQGEMSNLTMETAGTMKVLVVCGVGLMACLMALSLFGKRWLLFLR